MANQFGIPEKLLDSVRNRDKLCVYCGKAMSYPFEPKNRNDSATIEHLNFDGPFHWKDGLEIEDVVICCGECNSSRGKKDFKTWFMSEYCENKGINADSVAAPVKKYLERKRSY